MGRFIKALAVFVVLLALFVLLNRLRMKAEGLKIAVVNLKGTITQAVADDVISCLKEAYSRDDVVGIILRINSPGGAVAPSQEVYRYILEHRKDKKIYASIGVIGASGAYYIASACNRVFADEGSLVGSIGVIFAYSQIKELLDKIGVKPVVLKSGKYKDVGSPFRDMTDEERKYVQSLLEEIHAKFISDVAEARGKPEEDIAKIADGRVFTGLRAKVLGLADGVAPYWKVVEVLSKDLGYREPLKTVVIEPQKNIWRRLRSEAISFIKEVKMELLEEGLR